jgi:hypothetical protein
MTGASSRGRRTRALVRGLVVACLLAAICPGPGPAAGATLHRKFDFETTGYGGFGRSLTDHFLLEVAGTWHLFYTEQPSATVTTCRIGHATSTDLIHWSERPTVTTASGSGWLATAAWAPHVIARPGGGWMMFYTCRNPAGAQAIAGLLSSNLDTWTPASPLPLWTPQSAPWASWDSTIVSSCRDPYVWFEEGEYSMLYTATALGGRPAIGRARSFDLFAWTDGGPFAIDSTSQSYAELESPHLVFDNGRVELLYSRFYVRLLTAITSEGPWDVADGPALDAQAVAPEKLKSGTTQLLSRVRYDECEGLTSVIVIDTVTATAGGYTVPAAPGVPLGWKQQGDAFAWGATYGDGPARRGDVPAAPDGLRWVGSGETYRLPDDPLEVCGSPSHDDQVGWLRSPRFTLLGDSLWFRIMGATSIDSAYVHLLDGCTGLELARRTGPNTSALVPAAWTNAGRRGWPVEIELVDLLARPGGGIGADTFIDSTIGTFTAPTPVAINQTAPAGGENLTPGTTYTVRWTSFHPAGVDSHVVYVSYDNFATPPIRLQKRNGNQFSWGWLVPAGPQFNVRIRVVAYAHNGVHDCDTSLPFAIAITTGVPDPLIPGAELSLAARGSPGPGPVLEWSAPAGTRAWLRLYDVRGRLVRTLVAGETGPQGGSRRAAWDGRDEQGRIAPAGVFFAVLAGEDGARRRVTLVRLVP